MKKILFLFCFISGTIFATPVINEKNIKDMSMTYGFYLGQEYTLNKIAEKYPEYRVNVRKAKLSFKKEFGDAIENIDKKLGVALKGNWVDIKRKLNTQIVKELSSIIWNPQNAVDMINLVEERGKGNIESPVLETLLLFSPRYQRNPELEFIDGYKYKYNTNHHFKAKGVEFSLSLPKSWKAKEGERPNIVQKFISENGTGNTMFMALIKNLSSDADYEQITEQDVKELLEDKEALRDFLGGDVSIIDSGFTKIESEPTIWVKATYLLERDRKLLKSEMLGYFIFYKNRVIHLVGFTPYINEKSKEKDGMSKYETVFRMIVNSLILLDKY